MTFRLKKIPSLLFSGSDRKKRRRLGSWKKQGLVKRIGPRLYSPLPHKEASAHVHAAWLDVISELFPDHTISHRSAFELKPDAEGVVFLSGPTNREVHYPGLTLVISRGPKPQADDVDFGLSKSSSLARAFLENLAAQKSDKYLSKIELKERLLKIHQVGGDTAIQDLMKHAADVAGRFSWQRLLKRFEKLCEECFEEEASALSKTRSSEDELSINPELNQKLLNLYAELRHRPLVQLKDSYGFGSHFYNKAFVAAYANLVGNGTVFDLSEAEAIIFDKQVPKRRLLEAEDLRSMFELASDVNLMRQAVPDAKSFAASIHRYRDRFLEHRQLETVDSWNDVSLQRFFLLMQQMPAGLARAIFCYGGLCLLQNNDAIDERIAFLAMNAELHRSGLSSIIVPPILYTKLRAATTEFKTRGRCEALIQTLSLAHQNTARKFTPYAEIISYAREHNWFADASEAQMVLEAPL